jgi:hypothetical protein
MGDDGLAHVGQIMDCTLQTPKPTFGTGFGGVKLKHTFPDLSAMRCNRNKFEDEENILIQGRVLSFSTT